MKFRISLMVLFSVTVLAHGEGVQYSDPELHFSIKLPESWRRLPPGVADRAAEALARQTGEPLEKYQAWFQRSDKPEGDYPYILINRQICRMPTLGETADGYKSIKAAAEKANDRKGISSDSKMFDAVIDARRNMIFFEIEQTVNISDTGKVHGKICLFPGKVGVAQLNFWAAAADVDRSKVDFDFVLDSFVFEPGYGYQSGLAADAPTRGFDFSRLLMFGLIGGIFGPLCYRLLKSRNPNVSPSLLRLRVVFAMLVILGGLEFLIGPSSGPIRFTFVLGSIVVGVIGFAVSWIIEMKKPLPPTKDGSTDVLPPP
ncbi:MAG TPA: hypothetical protein DDY78_26265 [Planctomycetales bacterium]|nr:hypothetical protein [Planctomycetales bacterium]